MFLEDKNKKEIVLTNRGENKMDKKGFTLVELVIVIIIVGILSIISVPVYRGYVEKAMQTEGKTLAGAIAKAQLAYHVENEEFKNISRTDHDDDIDIDARSGKYFREFECSAGTGGSHKPNNNAIAHSGSINKADGDEDDDYFEEFSDHYVRIKVYGKNSGKSWTLITTQWGDGYMDDIEVEK